jgi:Beta-propeller domains of methanol dehydrogenase type
VKGYTTVEKEAELSDKLDEVSERQQVDIVVVTVDSLKDISIMEYADNYIQIPEKYAGKLTKAQRVYHYN